MIMILKNHQHLYLDMNSLYGWAMGKYRPYKRLKWLTNIDK